MSISQEVLGDERGTLLAFVEAQRAALRQAVEGLSEEQAAGRHSASELSLSGLLKHAAQVERNWLRMAQQQPYESTVETHLNGFKLLEGETIPSVLAAWEGISAELAQFVADLPSLDETFPLPPAPWFPENHKVSMRWMLLHLVEEFARHAGHADVIRESLDGTKAMG
ncbi:DinB family protein [Streptomyces antimicrobicus]|uniref:DinB family protein n=1 Tax=Streptomyces antimicrobicus TaxID=2883108 RepID=A0ABS8BFF8_9ACTN|nr:DinB family protein [Streptomyces antimicrobicus]MCB5183362.1 DinB family protein [Streptomyces antimicrobicus]